MKAVLLKGHGGYEQLEYRGDVPVPRPVMGEVLIQVRAAALNNTDINMRVGWYSKSMSEDTATASAATGSAAIAGADGAWAGGAPAFPLIQGADVCGHIVATGPGVATTRVGERVIVDPVLRPGGDDADGQCAYLGSDRDGAFSEFVCVPSINAFAITSSLTDAELASFPCSYSAAENMLTRARVGQGETVLVTGASGGVGSAAVQLAVRRGAKVIAVAGASKFDPVAQLGASEVLSRDSDIRAGVGPNCVDVVIDVVGGPQFGSLLEVLRREGRYAVAGAIAGPIVALDLRTLYLKDLRLLGCTIPDPEVFQNLVRYIERSEIRPVVARTYQLSAIVEAQRDFLSKRHTGKIVLLVSAGE
jgi:NADPH:quinone reductase-like Zn-dependent oxidoreductase